MIGRVLWDEFFSNRDWPVASAVAIVLLLLLIIRLFCSEAQERVLREAMMGLHMVQRDLADPWFCVSLHPDPSAGGLQLQREPPRDCLGRLVDQMVRRGAAR